MVCITLEFPLGVYHAQSAQAPDEPEWPPSPVRLIGALLAAAHGRHGRDPAPDRAIVQRLCDADPPRIVAPRSSAVHETVDREAAVLRGSSRWAPRNYFGAKGRNQAAVQKVGVAIGDRPLGFIWSDITLEEAELERLAALLSDVTFLGTTRSPVLARVREEPEEGGAMEPDALSWTPLQETGPIMPSIGVRVPDPSTIVAFDRRHELFRSTTAGVQRSAMVPAPPIGHDAAYAFSQDLERARKAFDPRWWGSMIVVGIDRERSDVAPKTGGAYLLARAMRVALLGAYEDSGEPGEAPPILRGRAADPHCAIVPLADVWHEHSDGHIMGIALLLPSEDRAPDLAAQHARVEQGLIRLLRDTPDAAQRFVQIPGGGRIWLKPPDATQARSYTLNRASYLRPAQSWVTITPTVHSRWQKRNDGGLLAQVTRDCSHVGLPEPASVEMLRGPGRPGGAARPVTGTRVPSEWRNLLSGPIDHVRITFPTLVVGPIVIGRARHFGLGLCVPDDGPRTDRH